MRVTYTGKFDDVMIGGGLENDREGYSAGLAFWSSDPMSVSEKVTIANVGLMLGEPDPAAGFPGGTFFTPYLVLRNTTSRPIEVRPTLYTISRARGLPLPGQHLKPFQSERVDVKAILEPLGLARMSGSANLTLSYTGKAGDLGVAAGSIDQTASYVFGVLSQQVMQTQSKEVPYWTVANGFDTMFALWNPTDEAQDIVAIFYYGDGSGQYKLPLHLEAEGSAMIDMARLVANGRPDADGNLFPTTARAGSVVFQSRKGFAAPMNLSINAATFNAELGTCLQHCICCTGVSTTALTPNPCLMAVSESMQAIATAYYNNGTNSNVTNSVSWSSSNTSISTVSSAGLVKGVSVGSATLSASGSFTRPGQVCGVGNLVWATVILTATSPADVLSVSQSPSQFNMSTGDTKQITCTVTPSTITVTTSFTGTATPTSNLDSSCAVTLSIPGTSSSGTISNNVTASAAGCSGVFSVIGSAGGVKSSSATTVQVPPQVLIQMMYGEAGGAGSTAQLAVGVGARNRFNDTTYFSGDTNYQNTIVSSQFNGIATSITKGTEPELDNAVSVWLRQTTNFITPSGKNSSQCFWTPSATEWTTVSNALQSGTTNETGIPNRTGCYSGAPYNQQIRVVSGVGNQSGGSVPNFIFQGARSSSSDPVVVNAN